MAAGSKVRLTYTRGTHSVELHEYGLTSFDVSETKSNDRVPGPGPASYRDTGHNEGTVSFTVDDCGPVRAALAAGAGKLAALNYAPPSGLGGDVRTYSISPSITLTAAASGSLSWSVTSDWLSEPTE